MRIFACISLLLFSIKCLSVPAYPHRKLLLLESDEQVAITLCGDEKQKWAISEDCYTLLPTEDGWVYAQEDEEGYASPSSFYLSTKINRDIKTETFLNGLKKKIPIRPNKESKQQFHGHITRNHSTHAPVIGNRKALVILMEFIDCEFKKQAEDFESLFNESGYQDDGAIGSVYDYFQWASHGQLHFYSDILGPFKTQHSMTYYGKNNPITSVDSNPYELFREAIEHASSQVDLSNYDANNDGYVDNVHIVYSGYGEESLSSPSSIWAHEMTFEPIIVQDMLVDRYSCAPELRGNEGDGISRIGTHCHEMGHALGAKDYYDTDYETNGLYSGTGIWDIMAQGSWNDEGISPANFNPYVRIYDFGWEKPQSLPINSYSVLESSNKTPGHIYRIDTPVSDEFYLIENRSRISFDESLPESGLHIYHVGSGIIEKGNKNKINSTFPQECYIVCASSEYKNPTPSVLSYGNINSTGTLYTGNNGASEFNDETIPSSNCLNGTHSHISLTEITLLPDGNVSLFNGTLSEPILWWNEKFEDEAPLTRWNIENESFDERINFYASSDIKNKILKSYFQLPEPLNGTNYLYIDNKEAVSCKGRIISRWIPYESFYSYMLSFVYHITSKTVQQFDGLSIYCQSKSSQEWKLLKHYSQTTNGWEETSFDITNMVMEEFRLAFEFNTKASSAICLDNVIIDARNKLDLSHSTLDQRDTFSDISITQEGSTTIFKSLIQENKLFIYDILGRPFYANNFSQGEEVRIVLPTGLFFLATKESKGKIYFR